MSQQIAHGPPYPPTTAGIGGIPTVTLDVPVTAVFMFLYLCFGATNMTILQINMRRKNHKFIISGAIFGFCMARTFTCVLRIALATHPHNIRLAIAANVFVNAGVLIIYVVNVIFAQRILRGKQPQLGWNPILRAILKVCYALIGLALIGVIASLVITLYTLNPHTRQRCRDIQLAATTYLFVFTTIPLFLLAAAHLLAKSPQAEHFGRGSMRRKLLILLGSTALCVTISGFKLGTAWMPPRPASHPAWYQSKACFYIFNFTLEILILTLLTASRIDQVFHIPNGSKGPGDYSAGPPVSSQSSEKSVHELEK